MRPSWCAWVLVEQLLHIELLCAVRVKKQSLTLVMRVAESGTVS